jgi:hypothetical protein
MSRTPPPAECGTRVPVVPDGLYLEAREQFAGCYLVDCGSRQRAIELAALLPDAKYSVMEVRAVTHEAGLEM